MPRSWNDIRLAAVQFVTEWKDKAPAAREEADAAEFERDFLNIFGDEGRKKAEREYKVPLGKNESTLFGVVPGGDPKGYIDLLWKGKILIEMKSPGKDLEKAYRQAKQYADAPSAKDFPQGILVSDFNEFRYYDFSSDLDIAPEQYFFPLVKLPEKVTLFSQLAGYTTGLIPNWASCA